MSADAQMPYFIKPSVNLNKEEKKAALMTACGAIVTSLEGETDNILKMATINCLLKTYLPYAYWVGFYIYQNNKLSVGPYQGTLGCFHIEMGKGVCGKAAQESNTQIIEDVHRLEQGEAHIACDPNSKSEIVLPVFDKQGALIAVLDIDSTEIASFDDLDKSHLEGMLKTVFE